MRAAMGHLASDLVALTSLPARWVGASPERIADDVAVSLRHLCPHLTYAGVRLEIGHLTVETHQPPAAPQRAWPDRGAALARVSGDESVVVVGALSRHGKILLAAPQGVDLGRARLLATIAANQVEAACRTIELEREAAQAHDKVAALSRLCALGQLVGGVAHEVRTPLTYATNHLYGIRMALTRHDTVLAAKLAPRIDEVEEAMDRIAGIVDQLRRLGRQDRDLCVEEDARDLVHDAVRLWRATHAGSCRVVERLRPTPPLRVDRGQVQQVVLNLVQNGADAAGPGGIVRVSTCAEDDQTLLVVEDTGPGLSASVRERLFQPFVTTKRDGLGLGLSIVRDIVEAHHGTIRIDSAEGQGTRVEVRLPRSAEG